MSHELGGRVKMDGFSLPLPGADKAPPWGG